MSKKYLINQNEADVLASLVDAKNSDKQLGFDLKQSRPHSNFPFRFKLKETIGATTANKALAQIFFFGDSTANIYSTDYVVDDSSSFSSASSGDYGICIASSEYHISYMPTATGSGSTQMGWRNGSISYDSITLISSSADVHLPSGTQYLANHSTLVAENTKLLWASTVNHTLIADITAYYKLGVSLTARSTTSNAFQTMQFGAYNKTTSTFVSGIYGLADSIYIDSSGTVYNLRSNIAFSGLAYLTSGYEIAIRNDSTFAVGVGDFHFWMERFST